jgi:lysophospholipase L1-like esterase
MGILDAPALSLSAADVRYARAQGSFNIGPTSTRKIRKALAKVRTNSGTAKILCLGDSTTWGSTSSGSPIPSTTGYPARLRDMLNTYYAPARTGLAIPTSFLSSTSIDTRWGLGAGWIKSATGFANNAGYKGSATSAPLTFTTTTNADAFDVYYSRNTGLGSIGLSVDGGAVTTVSTAGSASVQVARVTATAGVGHVLSIAQTGGDVFIFGVEPILTTESSIRVGNAGIPSSTTTQWKSDTNPTNSLSVVRAYAPDLTLLMLGINDAGAAVTAATWLTNVTLIAAAAAASGDVILMSVVPSNPASANDPVLEAQYADQGRALAASAGYGFIDVFERFGSYAISNAAGWMNDGAHPTDQGYSDMASAVFATLRSL